tara:strand:+ start:1300 stop:1518 length:219 start_codon:yes stop_codon:yes gene_type:complete
MSRELELLRNYRNKLLAVSDWTVLPDSPLSESKKNEWKTYRQSLRDITKNASPKKINENLDMSSVTFPTKPS